MKKYYSDIEKSVEMLNAGKVILYPTDTIWGLGCDAKNIDAVNKIYKIKKRTSSKSMIIFAKNIQKISEIIPKIPSKALEILETTEKPLTIIYPNAQNVAPNVIADDHSIAIRIPKDDFCLDLLSAFGNPIISTSANISGQPSAVNFSDISDYIKQNSDYIVNWKQNRNQNAKASTILKITEDNKIITIRE